MKNLSQQPPAAEGHGAEKMTTAPRKKETSLADQNPLQLENSIIQAFSQYNEVEQRQAAWTRLREIAKVLHEKHGKESPEGVFTLGMEEVRAWFEKQKFTKGERLEAMLKDTEGKAKNIIDSRIAADVNLIRGVTQYEQVARQFVEQGKSIADSVNVAARAMRRHLAMREKIAADPALYERYNAALLRLHQENPKPSGYDEYKILEDYFNEAEGKKKVEEKPEKGAKVKAEAKGKKEVEENPENKEYNKEMLAKMNNGEIKPLVEQWLKDYDNYDLRGQAHKNLLAVKKVLCERFDKEGRQYDKEALSAAFKLGSMSELKRTIEDQLLARMEGPKKFETREDILKSLKNSMDGDRGLKPADLQRLSLTQMKYAAQTIIETWKGRGMSHDLARDNLKTVTHTIYQKAPEAVKKEMEGVQKILEIGNTPAMIRYLSSHGLLPQPHDTLTLEQVESLRNTLS